MFKTHILLDMQLESNNAIYTLSTINVMPSQGNDSSSIGNNCFPSDVDNEIAQNRPI